MREIRFTIKFISKIIIYVIISALALNFILADPIISNELALGQMENSNELYLLMEAYNKNRNIVSIIYGCITVLFAGTTIYDIYKFINTKENKGEI